MGLCDTGLSAYPEGGKCFKIDEKIDLEVFWIFLKKYYQIEKQILKGES